MKFIIPCLTSFLLTVAITPLVIRLATARVLIVRLLNGKNPFRAIKWVVGLGIMLLATQISAGEAPLLKTQRDKVNYAIGTNMIGNFRQQGIEIDLELVIQGMRDALAGGKLLLSDEELRIAINQYQAAARQKQAKARALAAEENRKEGEAFLAGNMKQDGVVTLPSGLQYKILRAGDGKMPTDEDRVECNYRGTLINGTEFDSTYRTGKPSTFTVKDGIIPGVSEALKMMPAGSQWQLVIPSKLAYGERGRGRDIGPNATLIFELELLAVR